MKAYLVLMILPAFLLTGCSDVSTYYYHPQKTLEQAQADWLKCHDGLIRTTFKGTVIRKNFAIEYFEDEGARCMTDFGYIEVDEPDLHADVRKKQAAIGNIYYSVAGK